VLPIRIQGAASYMEIRGSSKALTVFPFRLPSIMISLRSPVDYPSQADGTKVATAQSGARIVFPVLM
jgi:hypothetical protein